MILSDIKITIIRSDRRTLSIQLKAGEVVARAPVGIRDKEIYSFIEEKRSWIEKHLPMLEERQQAIESAEPFTKNELRELTTRAKQIIEQRVSFYAPIIGVTYNRITIRCQRTRWGSCSASGNLSFNCLLALFPAEVIDCVVVHELCHRKHMNHSREFYADIYRILPEYDRLYRQLRDIGPLYIGRLRQE